MKKTVTQRGFRLVKFRDANGVPCSVQRSSSAERACIWIGPDDADPKVFTPFGNPPWTPLDVAALTPPGGHVVFNTRMHLTRKQVKKLIPLLQHFAEHGELP